MLLGDHIVKAAGVETEDCFDCALIFNASDGVGLVVIHIAGGDDQHRLAMRHNGFRQRDAELLERFELSGSERDRNESQPRLADL